MSGSETALLPRVLSSDEHRLFAFLTFPTYRAYLKEPYGQDGRTVGIGVEFLGNPVGLALARLDPTGMDATVLSIYVAPAFRRSGLGTRLLADLEGACRRLGSRLVRFMLIEGRPASETVQRMVNKLGWETLETGVMFKVGAESARCIVDLHWMRPRPLPEGLRIVPWSEVGRGEMDRLKEAQDAQIPIPPGVSPVAGGFEPEFSLALRDRDALAGWILTRRIGSAALLFERFYLRPETRAGTAALTLLAQAARTHFEREGGRPGFSWTWITLAANRRFLQLIEQKAGWCLTQRVPIRTLGRRVSSP